MTYYKLLLIFLLSIINGSNGIECFSCISPVIRDNFDDFINVPGSQRIMFPAGRYNCSVPKKITCKEECAGIKIEDIKPKNHSIGYLHGCAEHVFSKTQLQNYRFKAGEKRCEDPTEYDINYYRKAKITFCRCKDLSCNSPERDFVNADYIPPAVSQASSSLGSEVHIDQRAAAVRSSAATLSMPSAAKAATLATIGTNVLAISLSSQHQIDPLKFILSNLIAFFIYQMF